MYTVLEWSKKNHPKHPKATAKTIIGDSFPPKKATTQNTSKSVKLSNEKLTNTLLSTKKRGEIGKNTRNTYQTPY